MIIHTVSKITIEFIKDQATPHVTVEYRAQYVGEVVKTSNDFGQVTDPSDSGPTLDIGLKLT